MYTLRATYKTYIIFEMLPCYVNGFHIYNIFMHNVYFKSNLWTLYYIWNIIMLNKQISYEYNIYAQCRL